MEIRYSREMSHNYMIIEAIEDEGGYASQMLSANTIDGLLKFRMRRTEESREYYYEITSRQPLSRILQKRTLSGRELKILLLGILGIIKRVEEYLLKDEQILLEPEYIYIEPDRFTVNLCLIPGYSEDTPRSMSKLLEYLLERIDHQDREAVVLAYNLYQISLRENYGMADLLCRLAGEDKIFSSETNKNSEVLLESTDSQDEIRENFKNEEELRREISSEEGIYIGKNSKMNKAEIKYSEKTGKKYTEETTRTAKTNKKTVACIDKSDYEHEQKLDKKKERWVNSTIRVIGVAALAGIVYWYVTGEINIWLYVISALSGILTLAREYYSRKRKQRIHKIDNKKIKIRKESDTERDFSENRMEEEKNRWMIYPESEEEHKRELQREEEARIERIKDAGTTLLSAEKNKDGMVRLEPIEAGEKVIQITYVPFTIGKHAELSDACVDRPTVSRLHARIDQKEGVYILTDLNSTNGTSVNGYQLQANETVSLGNGDSIYMADIGYRFWEN